MKLNSIFYVALLSLAACATNERHDAEHGNTVDDAQIFKACDQNGWTEKVTPEQQKIIDGIFGRREHRMQHAFWHAMRSGLQPQDQQTLISTFGGDWKNTHPLCPPPQNNATDPSYNAVGEDFIYMNHEMVMVLRAVLTMYGQKCIVPWTGMPNPREWPLTGKKTGPKSAEAYAVMKGWDALIQDEKWMKTVSLSQLGWALEFTLSNNLHMRYAEDRPAAPFRAATAAEDGAPVPMDGMFPPSWKFDEPAYDWLADSYGAALNPLSWKIHGYIEQALQLWLKANDKTRVAVNCGSDHNCYQWRGQWVGNIPKVPTQTRALAASAPVDSSDFNKKRFINQRLGVLTAADFPTKGLPKAGHSDLLGAAAAKVCPAK